MPKTNYTPEFEKFWSIYPRKTAKATAFKSWQKLGVEDDAFLPTQIISDIEKRTRLFFWPKDKTKVPHAATWINQMRWEDTGWEDEMPNRKDDPVSAPLKYRPIEDTSAPVSEWEALLNRFWVKYVRHAGGIMDEQVTQSLRIKRAVLKEMVPNIEDEIEAHPEHKGEMIEMIVKTFLKRLDLGLQLRVMHRVITT